VLRGTSALLLRHDADAVGAAEVRPTPVTVTATASAAPSSTRLSAGQVLMMRGALSAPRAGVTVRLEQQVGTSWVIRAAALTSSTSAYALPWRPVRGGLMVLRVRIFPYGALTTGVTRSSAITVDDTSASLAQEILANPRIQLATGHLSGVRDLADPLHELRDLAAGRLAHRSAYGTAPGGSVMVTVATLRGLRNAGRIATIHVVELAGGTHARGSAHYLGLAFDIDNVNGRWVSYGSGYDVVVVSCRHSGATRVFHPAYDPYGGHENHIHVDWLVQ
jgi:zinc D-Ala-D-Ala carboxypeptidase